MLAVAIYDEQHHQIGDLGEPTAAVAALLPLPLYQCWCYLAQVACRLGEGLIMQQAAHVVMPHFVTTSPDRPLWEGSPLDSQTLHRQELALTRAGPGSYCLYWHARVDLQVIIESLQPTARHNVAAPTPARLTLDPA